MGIRAWNVAFCVFTVAFLLLGGCNSSDRDSSKNKVPDAVEERAKLFSSILTEQGFEVERGYFKLYTKDDCVYSYPVMKSCYGNNPAAPYIIPVAPYWEDEWVDPATESAFGPTGDGYSATYRLDHSEALVIFGVLPPEAAYFGMQTYLFSREGSFDTTSGPYKYFEAVDPVMLETFFATIPENPKRIQLFASLSNSVNNVFIERQSGIAFDQTRYFIITPDQNLERAVTEALNRAAVQSADIFTEPIPPSVKTGLDEQADDFLTVMRYSMPADAGEPGTPSDIWRNDIPLVVLRVRDASQAQPPVPYGPFVVENRTALDERGLGADLDMLTLAVSQKWEQPCEQGDCADRRVNFIDMQEPPMQLFGPRCMEIGMNCLGDTQDTTYQMSFNLPLDNDEVYAAIGTLGTATGNAKYVGLSVNYTLYKKGVENINGEVLNGTAIDYAGEVDNSEKLYVYYLTRDCSGLEPLTGGNCLSITEEMIPPCSPESSEPCGYAKIVQRDYIHPGTQRGPDSKQVLLPRLLKLQRPDNEQPYRAVRWSPAQTTAHAG